MPQWIWIGLMYVSTFVLVTGVTIGGSQYRRLNPLGKWIFYYLTACLLIDGLSRLSGHLWNNNLLLIPLFGIIELLFFYLLYRHFFKTKHPIHFILLMATIALGGYEIFTLGMGTSEHFQAFTRVLANFSAFLLIALYLLKEIGKTDLVPVPFLRFHQFALFYFGISLIVFIPANFLVNSQSSWSYAFWQIQLWKTVLFELLLIQLLWKHGRTLT